MKSFILVSVSFLVTDHALARVVETVFPKSIYSMPSFEVEDTPQHDTETFYRLYEIVIEGERTIAPKQIVRFSGLKLNLKVRAGTIDGGVERIRRAYLARGFAHISVSATKRAKVSKRKEGDEAITLIIRIDEGQRFLIRRIEFMGNTRTSHLKAQRATGLQLNQPYSALQIDYWLLGLNRLGRFERVQKENVEITINEKDNFVDVLFHVKERQ